MPSPFRAAVFDMDGTLVDNMPYHARAWVALAEQLGSPFDLTTFERELAGKKNEEILPLVARRPLSPEEIARLADEKEARYRALYAPHVAMVTGLSEFLERLTRAGIACAVATAAPVENRRFILERLGLSDVFATVTGAEDAPRGKPHPDIYLAAARSLDVPPSACVAFEDVPNGVRSAVAAGMVVVGVTTTVDGPTLTDAGASYTIANFASLPRELELRLGFPTAGTPDV